MSTTPWLHGKGQTGLLVAGVRQTVNAITAPGRSIIIEEPVPVAGFNTYKCLQRSQSASQCIFLNDPNPSLAERHYRQLTHSRLDVHTLDLDRMVCPRLPLCNPVVGGSVVRRDGDHLTDRMAAQIAPQIETSLKRTGALRAFLGR